MALKLLICAAAVLAALPGFADAAAKSNAKDAASKTKQQQDQALGILAFATARGKG